MVVYILRSKTQNKDKYKCRFVVTTPNIEIELPFDKTLWAKFMPGQVRIKAEAWYDADQKLIIGKVL